MGKRVLIFDDDEDILDICRYILEARGHKVFTKQTCKDVIADLRDCQPQVVIMDNWIPDIGGIKAIHAIREEPEFANMPVVLFTASKDIQSLMNEAKADAFIEKPFNIETLEEMVEKVFNRQ